MHAFISFIISRRIGFSARILKPNYKNMLLSSRSYNNISPEDISDVTVNMMRRTMQSHNMKYEEGHTCLMAECRFCAWQNSQPKCSKVYINKTTGFFICHCCKQAGSWKALERLLLAKGNDRICREIVKDTKLSTENQGMKQVLGLTKPLSKCSAETTKEIIDKFNLPASSNDSLNALNARIDERLEMLYVPLLDLDGRTCNFVTTRAGEKSSSVSAGTHGLVVARTNRQGGNSAVIVPTIHDAVALLTARVPGNVVCLPHGVTGLPQPFLPQFERFTKLTLWFGSGVASWDTARSFAKKLGEKRCFFVRPTDKHPLPSEITGDGSEIRSILSAAQPVWHKAITTFASLREDVLSDLQNIDKVQGVKWKRYPSLGRILKGHRRGELTIITGPTGSGKTTFVSEYSLDLAMQGVNTLWGSFEIRNARLARTMLQQMSGLELDQNLHVFERVADEFEKLPIYFMTFHGQQPVKLVMEAVEHATYVHDIAHVVVDNVQFMMGLGDEPRHSDRFWKQDAIVAAFRSFATRKHCHVTLVMHPRKERDAEELTTSSIFGGAKASQEADNVLIIQDKRLTSLRGKKYLQVVKNRYSGDLGVMPLEFDKAALSYAQKKKKPEEKPPAASVAI